MINKIVAFKGIGDLPRVIKARDVKMSNTPRIIGSKKDEFVKKAADAAQGDKSAEEIARSVMPQTGIDDIIKKYEK